MEETKVLVKPKITRTSLRLSALENLKESTEDLNKTSLKLKKLFERNTYQKKTQLSVLKRYKRRLDAIEREEEARRKRSSRKKIKLPAIKKFVGSFFAPGASSDPFKALASLAAFNTATNLADGKFFDAFVTGLTAAGLVAGPSLIGMGVNRMFNRGGDGARPKRGPKVTGDRGSRFRNPFKRKPKVTGDAAKTAKIGKAFGRFGKAIIPGVGAAVGAIDATLRAQEGDVTGASIAGTSATLDALAATSAATGIGLPVAGLLSIASFALDVTNLVRDLSGASEKEISKNKNKKKDGEGKTIESRLKEQTQKQKETVRRNRTEPERGPLTFGKTLDGYEKVIKKFEEFSKVFELGSTTGEDGIIYPDAPNITPDMEYTGPVSGETFFPLPGGQEGQQANQQFDAPRDGGNRLHKGLDMVKFSGSIEAPVVAYKTGKVVESVNAGYNGYVTISHGNGLSTRYYHINPSVSVGQNVYGGEQIGTLFNDGQNTHLHFEVITNGTKVDPKSYGTGRNRITSPLSKDRAKEHHERIQNGGESKTTPDSKTKASPEISIKPSNKVVSVSADAYYTQEKGKYYENGVEVPKDYMNTIIKNNRQKFKDNGWISSRNIEVDTEKKKTALVFIPQVIAQTPLPQMGGDKKYNLLPSSDVNSSVASLYYNKTLLLS